MNSYDLGTLVKCRMRFYTDSSRETLTDPTIVLFRTKAPSGVVTEHTYGTDVELVRSSVGDYYENVDADEPGVWEYLFEGDGGADIVLRGRFNINRVF